jgi:ABC-2 type transport system permease protein
MILCVMGTVYVYNVPFRGSYFVLFIITSSFLLTALGTGLLFSVLTKNQLAASQAAQVGAFLPAYMLSGIMFEIASMPKIIQVVTNFVPAKYFVSSLLTIFLVGNVWSLIIKNVLIMLFMGVFIFVITSRLIVKRLD